MAEAQDFFLKHLEKANVKVHLDTKDFRGLSKEEGAWLIVNDWLGKEDEWAVAHAFKDFPLPVRIITSFSKDQVPVQLQPYYLAYGVDFWNPEALKNIVAVIRATKELGQLPFMPLIVLPFGGRRLKALKNKREVNTFCQHIKDSGLPVVPVRLSSSNGGLGFSPLRRWRQAISTSDLDLHIRVGKSIAPSIFQEFDKIDRLRKYLQSKIFCLGTGVEVTRQFFFNPFQRMTAAPAPIAAAQKDASIQAEMATLEGTEAHLLSQGEFEVYMAHSEQIPTVLKEIGRLREITFRSVQEGTGKAYDLDEYDLYYLQLIIWDKEAGRIVGGYRLGPGDQIFEDYGVEGFYVHSLFKIDVPFYEVLQQSVELGRSYIVEEYQRKRLPLFLLWQGIRAYILKHPHYRYLYGPMSISKHYSDVSKSLIIAFVKKFYYDPVLAQYLHPRKPFKVKLEKVDIEVLLDGMSPEMQSFDEFIASIEPTHFRLPVLLKQYIKQNAKFISFNVDPDFSDALDGFMILDLQNLELDTIEG